MKKIDARKLPSKVQEEKRKQAIRLHKKGKRYKEIAELLEVHFETVGKWVRAYRVNRMKALLSNVRGRRRGSSRKLTPEHEDIIQRLIVDKTPDQNAPRPKGRGIRRALAVYHRIALYIVCLGCGHTSLSCPHYHAFPLYKQNSHHSRIHHLRAVF